MSRSSHIEVPSKDLVRKIRPAFAGVPDDSPFNRHLLVWSQHDVLRAAFISDLPDAFSYEGSIYHLQQPYIGDWDALISPAKRLAGFALIMSGNEQIITSDFLQRHQQLKYANGMLQLILSSAAIFDIECVQGMGTRLFVDSRGDYLFLFPEWSEWGETKFPLCTAEAPISV